MTKYQEKEIEFAARRDCLCENTIPANCDCSQCPARDLCAWLCENDPNK